ncbi:MAG: hypothetical protein HY860_02200 [Chlamydiales bacterium]|nr:hypothetical protein [Chlamydiales bacterium]
MWQLSLIPFALQGIVIVLDEALFHVKRGLPAWERKGHPLDTLTVIICLAYVTWIPFSKLTLGIYLCLAIFSSIFVTKDEFVHKEYCSAKEIWLHAVLFTLHPIVLIMAGFIWPVAQGIEVSAWLVTWLNEREVLALFLRMQLGIMMSFFFYQIIFWNILWKDKPVIKHQ